MFEFSSFQFCKFFLHQIKNRPQKTCVVSWLFDDILSEKKTIDTTFFEVEHALYCPGVHTENWQDGFVWLESGTFFFFKLPLFLVSCQTSSTISLQRIPQRLLPFWLAHRHSCAATLATSGYPLREKNISTFFPFEFTHASGSWCTRSWGLYTKLARLSAHSVVSIHPLCRRRKRWIFSQTNSAVFWEVS